MSIQEGSRHSAYCNLYMDAMMEKSTQFLLNREKMPMIESIFTISGC